MLGIVAVAAVLLGVVVRWAVARPVVVGGGVCWVALSVWRSASARASGANLWFVSLVVLVIPAAAIVVAVVHYVAKRQS